VMRLKHLELYGREESLLCNSFKSKISEDFKLWMVNGLIIQEPQLNTVLYYVIS
jgi:hypothetical protein